jgi:hypothetical protein
MSQNGPWPGPPSHPWSSSWRDEPHGDEPHREEPYTEPADPWGDQNTPAAESGWGGHPTSLPPAPESSLEYPSPYAAPQPAWSPPPALPPHRRNGPIVALVVVLGLLIVGGLATTAILLNKDDNTTQGNGPLLPSTQPTTAANVADPQPSEDARFVKKGQCVRNEGSSDTPQMTIVPCASGTYEVLKRVDGRTTGEADAESKCSKVPNYTKWYFYDSELDSLDFVLCLKER